MSKGEKAINNKFSVSLPQSFFRRKMTALPSCGARFCLCGLERRTKSTAAPTDVPFTRHRRRSHLLPVRESLCLQMRLGAPHKIYRCADKCSLTAVKYKIFRQSVPERARVNIIKRGVVKMRKQYIPPRADFVIIEENDVITASLTMPMGSDRYKLHWN